MHVFELKSYHTYWEDILKAWMNTDLNWPTKYQTKRKAGMELIAESSAGLGQKRTRLGSDSVSTLSRMTRSPYTPLQYPNTGLKEAARPWNKLTSTMVLLIKGWPFCLNAHISHQFILHGILNAIIIDGLKRRLESKWWHAMIAMSHCVL